METVSNENMTVKQLAIELGVSPQGINKYLRTSGLQEEAIKDGNRFLIPPELADKIRNHFQKQTETETETDNEVSKENTTSEMKIPSVSSEAKAIDALTKQLELLQKQLEIKDNQIQALTDALANANESNKALSAANAVYVAADKKELILAEPKEQEHPQEEKRSFWKRLFG